MKCKFKFKNGKPCKYHTKNREKLCDLHNPNIFLILFIEDYKDYKKNTVVSTLPANVAQGYIDKGVAVKYDYKQRIRREKVLLKLINRRQKVVIKEKNELVSSIKEIIALQDIKLMITFLKQGNPDSMLTVITSHDFTKKEREYMQGVVKKYGLFK